jgi:hypothetical protein
MSSEKLDQRFGALAVAKGFITSDQLIEAIKIQVTENLSQTTHRLIGEILRDQGYLTAIQTVEVLNSMGIYEA